MQPLLFTRDFRRKMAELSQAQRLDWLASLAVRFRRDPSPRLAPHCSSARVAKVCRKSWMRGRRTRPGATFARFNRQRKV